MIKLNDCSVKCHLSNKLTPLSCDKKIMEGINKQSVGEMHFHLNTWANSLAFYMEELNIFQKRLNELCISSLTHEKQKATEQFQARFSSIKNRIAELEKLIQLNEENAVASGKMHIRRVDEGASEQYLKLKESVHHVERLYGDLKTNFYSFCKNEV
jgi:hypothetical protein